MTPTMLKTSKGFTLIEIVIAVALLAVITTVTYGSITALIKSKKTLDDNRIVEGVAESLLSRMIRELQMVTKEPLLPPCNSPNSTQTKSVYFLGERGTIEDNRASDRITFVAEGGGQFFPGGGGNNSGKVQVQYRIEKDPENNNEYSLFRDEWPLIRPAEKACKKHINFSISKNIYSLSFRFYDSDNDRWVDSWDSNSPGNPPGKIFFVVKLKSPLGKIKTYSTMIAPRFDN